jgi:hypothetical protein
MDAERGEIAVGGCAADAYGNAQVEIHSCGGAKRRARVSSAEHLHHEERPFTGGACCGRRAWPLNIFLRILKGALSANAVQSSYHVL